MNVGVVMYQTSFTKGQELVAQRMAQELSRQGHRAFLIAGPYHENELVPEDCQLERSMEGYQLFEKSEFKVPLIRVKGYQSTWPPRRVMFLDFVSVLRRLLDKFSLDAIISHSTLWNGPEEITKFVRWRKMLRTQGIGDEEIIYGHMSHLQPPDRKWYNIVERTFRTAWNSLVLPHVFEASRILLCTTPLEEDQMVAYGARKKQCMLYPGGIDEEVFRKYEHDDPKDFLQKYSIPTDAKLVTYLGTIEERKNPVAVARIARLLKSLRNVHFIVAGHPSNQTNELKEVARKTPNLNYVGDISERDKASLMKASYVNILLSHMESLGLTQLEFMYNGVPIVTSAVGGQRWLIRDGKEGIYTKGPEDLKGAAKAIRNLVNDPTQRHELSKNAKIRCRRFTLTRITRDLCSRIVSLKQNDSCTLE